MRYNKYDPAARLWPVYPFGGKTDDCIGLETITKL